MLATGSACWQVGQALLAQPSLEFTPRNPGSSGFDWIRLGGLILVTGFGFLLTFYAIYPSMLKQRRAPMPLTLYGRCLAGWLFVVQVLILVLFWREFVWGDQTKQINTLWPKIAWVAWMILSSGLSAAYFRTQRQIRV